MIDQKIMELHLFVNQEREKIFLARQRGAVMAFIPDLISQGAVSMQLFAHATFHESGRGSHHIVLPNPSLL